MSQSLVPYIPEDAPFTPAQRSWLNGYLAGLYSYAPPQAIADTPQTLRVALLYGSQTGTAEGLARKFSKELKAAGHTVLLASLEGYVPATLAAETHAIFIVSTHGEGEAPDPAQPFFQQLCVEHFPGSALPTAARTLDWLRANELDQLSLLLDLGHSLISRENPCVVVDQAGALVQKNGRCFLERDTVLDQVGSSLTLIPGKLDIAHSIILAI